MLKKDSRHCLRTPEQGSAIRGHVLDGANGETRTIWNWDDNSNYNSADEEKPGSWLLHRVFITDCLTDSPLSYLKGVSLPTLLQFDVTESVRLHDVTRKRS